MPESRPTWEERGGLAGLPSPSVLVRAQDRGDRAIRLGDHPEPLGRLTVGGEDPELAAQGEVVLAPVLGDELSPVPRLVPLQQLDRIDPSCRHEGDSAARGDHLAEGEEGRPLQVTNDLHGGLLALSSTGYYSDIIFISRRQVGK